jgi:cytochrome P450
MEISHEIVGPGLVAPCFRYDPGPPQLAQVPGAPAGTWVLVLKRWRAVHAALQNGEIRDLGADGLDPYAMAGVTLQRRRGLLRRSDGAARKLLNPVWRRTNAEALRPAMRELALRCAADARDDLISGFVGPYIHAVTRLVTGLGDEDAAGLHALSDQTTGALIFRPGDRVPVLDAWDRLYDLTYNVPYGVDSLIGRSVRAMQDARLPADEAHEVITTVYNGLPTVRPAMIRVLEKMLGSGPVMAACAGNHELLASAVSNALRTSAHFIFGLPGMATSSTSLDGVACPAGTVVLPVIHAAHNDPSFPRLMHLAWGAGLHACLGRYVATVILEEGLAAVAARSPRLAVHPDELDWEQGTMPVPLTLPVSW